jgi:hypothetical protein
VRGASTGFQFGIYQTELTPGAIVPLHKHPFAEFLYVLDGSFTFNQSVQDPTEFSAVEVWRSRVDIDKHEATPHMKKFFDTIGKMFAPGYPIQKSYKNLDEIFEE